MPQTVPEDLLQEANAATALVNTVAEFAGPAFATALVLGVGAGWAFALDAATFLVSAAFLIRVRPRRRGEVKASASLLVELREGWTEFRARTWVWATVAIFSFLLIFALAPYVVLGATVAEDVYGSRGFYGVLAAALGVGTIAGALIGLRWRPERPILAAFVREPRLARRDRGLRRRRAAAAAGGAVRARGRRASRCSRSGGTRRWRSGSRRTRSAACRATTGWARSRCCRSATCSRARSARRSGRPR